MSGWPTTASTPGVAHLVWQPEVIEQFLGAHVRFFRRHLAPDAKGTDR